MLAVFVPDANNVAAAIVALVFMALVDSTAMVALLAARRGLRRARSSACSPTRSRPRRPPSSASLGGILGQLLRSAGRNEQLEQETQVLRVRTRETEEQARWLEQRTSLARELHDVVGHHVTAMVVQAEAGQVGDPQSALRQIATSGRTALGELDALVVHLRDPDAELASPRHPGSPTSTSCWPPAPAPGSGGRRSGSIPSRGSTRSAC